MKSTTEILRRYAGGELSLEDANKELEASGAGFHLEPGKESGWTEAEMAAGFLEPEEKKEPAPRKPDLSRRRDLAGQTVLQRTVAGPFEVTYDQLGYAVKASRVGFSPEED